MSELLLVEGKQLETESSSKHSTDNTSAAQEATGNILLVDEATTQSAHRTSHGRQDNVHSGRKTKKKKILKDGDEGAIALPKVKALRSSQPLPQLFIRNVKLWVSALLGLRWNQ